jgi:hypothetical protein
MVKVLIFLAENGIPSSFIRLQHQHCLHIVYPRAANLHTKFIHPIMPTDTDRLINDERKVTRE